MKHLSAVLLCASLPLLSAATLPMRYVVDSQASAVSAKVAFFGVASKTAQFPKVTGDIVMGEGDPSAIALDIRLDARALTAPDRVTRDRLRGEKFFWVDRYPTVRFVGSRVVMQGETSGRIKGELTVRGATRPVELAITFDRPPGESQPGEGLDLTGKATINRREFGMTAYSLIVGKNVDITIRARMVPR